MRPLCASATVIGALSKPKSGRQSSAHASHATIVLGSRSRLLSLAHHIS